MSALYPLNILLITNPANALALPDLHADLAVIASSASVSQAQQLIQNAPPDCILLEYPFPDADALLDQWRIQALTVVLLVDRSAEAAAFAAVQNNSAADYLVIPGLTQQSLHKTVHNAVERTCLKRQLAQAHEQMAQAHEQMDTFISSAYHDLKSPVRRTYQLGTRLKKHHQKGDSNAFDRDLSYILSSSEQMDQLLDGLRAYTRSGQLEQPLAPVDLNAILHRVRAQLRDLLTIHKLQFNAETLPIVRGNASRLSQLFKALVHNAALYQANAPPIVHFSAIQQGNYWHIACCDNGIGIAPHHVDLVFLPLKRLHTKEAYPGIGLGLAISRKIVEAHGGQLWVESSPGKGSTFFFTLPAVDPKAGTANPTPPLAFGNESTNETPDK